MPPKYSFEDSLGQSPGVNEMDFFGNQSSEEPDAAADASDNTTANPSRNDAPLAERMRPRSLEDWVGQREVIGPESFLARLLETGELPSLIFWGPPGCGKTTLAMILAERSGMSLHKLSAVVSGIKDVRAIIEQARLRKRANGRRTILFVDEIHRFNKAQQDAFLPHVEDGTIVLFGATTENPSFSVVAPLLSRARVLVLGALTIEDLVKILERAMADTDHGLGSLQIRVEPEILQGLAGACDGDARRALSLLDQCASATRPADDGTRTIDEKLVAEVSRRTHLLYDKSGDAHFNLISAFHKSLRASDPQAALYWMARMLASGEDPLYVGRRLVRFASEDIGLADPAALTQALAGVETFRLLGSPEGELGLVQAALYLATCPKSNSLYTAWKSAAEEIARSGALGVPLALRNAPTKLMKETGHGGGYQYDHDYPEHFSGQRCLPPEIKDAEFYRPGSLGIEREISKRMEWWTKRRSEIESDQDS